MCQSELNSAVTSATNYDRLQGSRHTRLTRSLPILVRDELLKCFESANKEFMEVLHQPATDAAIKAQVQQFVTGVFQNCGVSFDNPTKAGSSRRSASARRMPRR